jgi:hypothetical protein
MFWQLALNEERQYHTAYFPLAECVNPGAERESCMYIPPLRLSLNTFPIATGELAAPDRQKALHRNG